MSQETRAAPEAGRSGKQTVAQSLGADAAPPAPRGQAVGPGWASDLQNCEQ